MPRDSGGVESSAQERTGGFQRLIPSKIARKRLVWLLTAVIAIGLAVAAWQANNQARQSDKYRVEPVTSRDITQSVSANGTLNPVVLVNVGTQVSGTVKKLLADFNDHVKAGQVLLELDPALLQAQVNQDLANVANARATLELAIANEARSRTLWDQDSIAKQALDTAVQTRKSAEAQLAQAEATLTKDKTNLDYTVIRSPVSGVVVNRAVDLGQTVAASFQTPTLFQIAQDLSNMQIDSSFAEADIGKIKVGQTVQFTVDAFPERVFRARVRQIRLNATTQQNVVTYDVVVGVDNPDQILMPGMTAYVSVQVAQSRQAVAVPNAALRFRPSNASEVAPREKAQPGADARSGTVYVTDGRNLRSIPVRAGISDGRFTEILAGEVRAGDAVVVGTAEAHGDAAPTTLRLRAF